MSTRTSQRRRNTRATNEIVVIYWRDIPAQLVAHVQGSTYRHLLDARYQKAIDKAARVAGLTDHHRYMEQWRRETRGLDGADPQQALTATAAALDAEHDRAMLAALVRAGGVRPIGDSQ